MNGYLVMVRCQSDDIPVRLCASRETARQAAREVTVADLKAAERTLSLDSTPLNVSIYRFQDGALLEADVVRDFEDEKEADLFGLV